MAAKYRVKGYLDEGLSSEDIEAEIGGLMESLADEGYKGVSLAAMYSPEGFPHVVCVFQVRGKSKKDKDKPDKDKPGKDNPGKDNPGRE